MGDHRTIANGEFIICEREFRTGRRCGSGFINREEREISRHYQKHHGQKVNYRRCAIVTEAAVSRLVPLYKVNKAKAKNDGRDEREPTAPRYPAWMPGGGRAAYLAALATNPDPPRPIDDSDAEDDAEAEAEPDDEEDDEDEDEDELADNPATLSAFHPLAGKKIRARAAATASDPERRLGPRQATRYDHKAPAAAKVPTFGDWDVGESGLRFDLSSSEASDASSSPKDDAVVPPKRPAAIKTVPGYGVPAASKSPTADTTRRESVEPHDFTGFSHARGFLTREAFDSVVGSALDAINPFCMSVAAWDHAVRVVNAFFRTNRSDIIKDSFVEFLGLFGHKADFVTEQLIMTQWFYAGRSRTESYIWENAAAVSTELEDDEDSDDESWDKAEAHRCYACGVKVFSFRELDDHYLAEHGDLRDVELSNTYRGLWHTKLLAMRLEIDDDDEESAALPADGFACHHCDVPFDDLDAIDRHFVADHRIARKSMVLRIFDQKSRESDLAAWYGKDPVIDSEQSAEEEDETEEGEEAEDEEEGAEQEEEVDLQGEEDDVQQVEDVNNGESGAVPGAKRSRRRVLSNDDSDIGFDDVRPAKMRRSME